MNLRQDRGYAAESRELDAEILGVIRRWHDAGESPSDAAFDDLALRLCAHQLRFNRPYARYCATLGVTPASLPRSWADIPPAPAAAFKDAELATFDPAVAALSFETSGTTAGRAGRHFMESAALYEAALLAAFDRFVLPDRAALQYFNLVPDPRERPASSLGYMMGRVSEQRGAGETGWYVHGDRLSYGELLRDLREAIAAERPVCIAATAFALVHVLDHFEADRIELALPAGSRIMETGGFKGRTRTVDRRELYRDVCRRFGVELGAIVAEYGMTELTSQYYDDVLLRGGSPSDGVRTKVAPPWLRTRVVGPDGATLAGGVVGALVHVDLANRASCVAVSTEDLGVCVERSAGNPQRGIVLIGREAGADLRGCSLDAEALRGLTSA